MNPQNSRSLLSQALIALAICVGAWLMLVKPKIDQLAKINADLAEQKTATSSALSQQAIENAAKRASSIRTQLEKVESFNQLARDSSRLYGLVMEMAESHGIQVHSLQPGSAKQAAKESEVTATRLNMMIEGPYEQIADFLQSVASVEAFIRPATVQLLPSRTMGRGTVEATFACDVLSFKLSDALAQVGGNANGQP